MKKFLAILLSVVMLLGCVVISTSAEGIAVETPYDGAQANNWGHTITTNPLVGGAVVDYQFRTRASFSAISAHLALFGADRNVAAEVSLYAFDTDRETTLAGEAIQTWIQDGNGDGWKTFALDDVLPAGEYIVVIASTGKSNNDFIWYRHTIEGGDPNGILTSTFGAGGGEDTSKSIPAFKVIFAEEVADGKYFAKAGEVVEPEETVAPETTAPAPEDTAAPETDAPAEPEAPAGIEVAVDNKGATENHGLTMTTGVGYLGLSYQFKTTAAFNAFSAKLGFFAADRTISVTITKIGSDEPIQTWLKTGDPDIIPDNYWGDPIGQSIWVTFELDEELPAGEYIIQMGPAEGQSLYDVIWKKYDVKDDLGIFESVSDTFDWEKETARNSTPCFKVTFTEEVADGKYFAKAGEVEQTYVYINSLDGTVLYTGNEELGELSAELLAKLNVYANGDYNSFVKFEEISCEDNVHTFYSVHNKEADVTVNGGEAEEKDGYYVLTAGAPAEGQYFAGWYIGDVLLSYSETFKFFPNVATADLVAKYDTEAPAKNSNVGVEVDRTSDKLTVSVFPIYGDNAIVEFGYYVATSIQDMTADAVIAAGKKLDSHAPHAYMVRVHAISETTQNKHIYVVGYYTYVDGNGDTQTVYTGVYAADSLATKVIIDSDTYTYVNNNQWMANPVVVDDVAGMDGKCLRFESARGTLLGYNPSGSFEMVAFTFEKGATYSFSFDYKAGENWEMNSGDACMPIFFNGKWLAHWDNTGKIIKDDGTSLISELVCVDEENDIWHYTVTFVAEAGGEGLEIGIWYNQVDIYLDNIILEKIA